MKLTARDSDAFLKSPNRNCCAVLLYGPDKGLVRERSKQIAALLLGANADPMNRIELTGDQVKADPAILLDELNALSLMGGNRVVILQSATDKIAAVIEGAFTGSMPAAYLIAEAEELSASSPLRLLFEREARLAALPCYHDEGRSLDEVIREQLRGYGLSITPDAMRHLSSNLGNDRGVTLSEIAKIALYMGDEKEITLPVVLALCDYNAAETTEDICHFISCGEVDASQTLLTHMLKEGIQPVAIVRSLLKHFQRLDLLRAQIDGGTPQEQAISTLRPAVFYKYKPKLQRALGMWRARNLSRALDALLRTELELKSNNAPPALVISHALLHTARLAAA